MVGTAGDVLRTESGTTSFLVEVAFQVHFLVCMTQLTWMGCPPWDYLSCLQVVSAESA